MLVQLLLGCFCSIFVQIVLTQIVGSGVELLRQSYIIGHDGEKAEKGKGRKAVLVLGSCDESVMGKPSNEMEFRSSD